MRKFSLSIGVLVSILYLLLLLLWLTRIISWVVIYEQRYLGMMMQRLKGIQQMNHPYVCRCRSFMDLFVFSSLAGVVSCSVRQFRYIGDRYIKIHPFQCLKSLWSQWHYVCFSVVVLGIIVCPNRVDTWYLWNHHWLMNWHIS